MQHVYLIRETGVICETLNNTYEEMLAALKYRNPKANNLSDDEELSQLHDLLVLIRLGYINVRWAEDEDGTLIIFEFDPANS